MRILAFADDMTGALEVGAKLAAHGIGAQVHTRRTDAAVQVIDTETRHLAASGAHARVLSFATAGVDLIYKKTDSTLRGNIGAELRALSEFYPHWKIGYAPAYPALGRTVKDGVLLVDGVPVHQTVFGRDALNPVPSSVVRDVTGDLHCTIFDGSTDADIDAAARLLLSDAEMRIAAGPAAFVSALARMIAINRDPVPPLPVIPSCEILNGSRHPASSAQIDHALQQGCASTSQDASWRIIERGAAPSRDCVIVFGGDTAFDLVTAMGALPLTPLGEPLPGVVVSRAGHRIIVSKAGGFGEPDLLCRLRELLDRGRE